MTALSVIVPTLDEEDLIEATLRSARGAAGPAAELLVADGGSRDATVRRAVRWARVVESPSGRGSQLNAGARAASGRVLLFVHADTLLAPDTGRQVLYAVGEGAVGGCCRFSVHPPAGAGRYALLERGVNLRTRLFRTATGDQAIFATREAFRAVGGFPDWPLFEDVEFVRRLARHGRFQPLGATVRTSRRRWERDGFWRTVLLHVALRGAFWAGVPAAHLARWYGDRRPSRRRPRRAVTE